MKVKLSLAVYQRLLAYAAATPDEFSGFGFCERDGSDIYVYDFVLLNKGSYTYTEIPPSKINTLMDRPDAGKMKVWCHRHPMGNGIPGPHNWSGTDQMTILKEPMGGTPQTVQWSVSVVLTPLGFVGRIDNYIKGITQHLEVTPNCTAEYQEIRELAARSPFRALEPRNSSSGVSSAGNGGTGAPTGENEANEVPEEEWEGFEAEEEGYEPDPAGEPDGPGNVFDALRALIREFDPRNWTLAQICEEYGLDWEFERSKIVNHPRLWR